MLDLQRIIILCLPSLLFAATVEPGRCRAGKTATCFFSFSSSFPWIANFPHDCFKVFFTIHRWTWDWDFCAPIGTSSILDCLLVLAMNVSCPWALFVLSSLPRSNLVWWGVLPLLKTRGEKRDAERMITWKGLETVNWCDNFQLSQRFSSVWWLFNEWEMCGKYRKFIGA